MLRPFVVVLYKYVCLLFLFFFCFTNLASSASFTAFSKTYHRTTGAPIVEVDAFSVLNPNTIYTLEIYNGGLTDSEYERVSSSIIQVNGSQVAGPSNFNQHVHYFSRQISLNPKGMISGVSSNELSVELRGKPGGAVVINILGLDNDPPEITPQLEPLANASGWHHNDVLITFNCSDAISGVLTCPSPITVSAEGGNQTFTVTASDIAGNEATATVAVSLDKTQPNVLVTTVPTPNPAGWNNATVTVSYTCSDSLSGVVSCPVSYVQSTEGLHTLFETVSDVAGNSLNVATPLKIDLTNPSINSSQLPLANLYGWNNQDVTVSFTCVDTLSGVADCPNAVVWTGEGMGQQVEGTALDSAGNSATTVHHLNIDKTPPEIIANQMPLSNEHGWVNQDVTISFTCNDALSGLETCSEPSLISTEGLGQVTNGQASDRADNVQVIQHAVNVDRTPPVMSSSQLPLANELGWNNQDITLSFTCEDSLSGILNCPPPQIVMSEGLMQEITVIGEDKAGNTAQITHTVSVDKTTPVISVTQLPLSNVLGWNNSDVTLSFSCTDTLSGIAQCPEVSNITQEGTAQVTTGQATDNAGNTASASLTLNIDKTAPTISASILPLANAAGWHNQDATVDFQCVDHLSGVAHCEPQKIISSEGANIAIAGQATDNADNQANVAQVLMLNIDKTAPILTIDSPLDRVTVTEEQLTVAGQVTEPHLKALSINGVSVTPDAGGSFSQILTLAEGENTITVSASDLADNMTNLELTITYISNRPPEITSVPLLSIMEGDLYHYDVEATDVDLGDVLAYSLASGPIGMSIDSATGVIQWAPDNSAIGMHDIVVRVTDLRGAYDEQSYQLTVQRFNSAPVITSEPVLMAAVGQEYRYQLTVEDAEDDVVSYQLTAGPAAALIDPLSGLITWPTLAEGSYPFTVSIDDGFGGITEQSFSVAVVQERPPLNYLGTEFWFMFNEHIWLGGKTRGSFNYTSENIIFISSLEDTQAIIELPGHGYSATLNVPAGSVVSHRLPLDLRFELHSYKDGVQNSGVRVTTSKPSAVYIMNTEFASTDAALVLPTHFLGKTYYVSAYKTLKAIDPGDAYGKAKIGIVATEDNTRISITPPSDMRYDDPVGTVVYSRVVPAYDTVTITLNRGQTFQAETYHNQGFLTGALIDADKPIAVFGGNRCGNVPAYRPACDHLVEQVVPHGGWGVEHFTVPLATRVNGDTFRIIAKENETRVWINGALAYQLQAGEFTQLILDEASHITSTHPILITQFSHSSSYDSAQRTTNTKAADPFMVTVPTASQFLAEYIVYSYGEGIDYNFFNIVVDKDIANQLSLDGLPLEGGITIPIPGTNYVAIQQPVTGGQHRINGPEPFGLYIYGFGYYNSYGYIGGLTLNAEEGVASISVNVSDVAPAIGSEVCLDIGVLGISGLPLVSTQVKIDAQGSHVNSSTQITNEYGITSYCYYGTQMGVDQLSVAVKDLTKLIEIDWANVDPSVNHRPDILSNPVVAVRQGDTYNYQLQAVDPDLDILTYTLESSPLDMAIDHTGLLQWSIPLDFEKQLVTVKVSDGRGGEVRQRFLLRKELVINHPIVITSVPLTTVITGHDYLYTIEYSDAYNDDVDFHLISAPSGMSLVDEKLRWRPETDQVGEHQVEVMLRDGYGSDVSHSFTITVSLNRNPIVTSTFTEEIPISLNYPARIPFEATDPDGDPVRLVITPSKRGMSTNNSDLSVRINITDDIARFYIESWWSSVALNQRVLVADGFGGVVEVYLPIRLYRNSGPSIVSMPDTIIEPGVDYQYAITATDPEGDTLNYTLREAPTGMSVSPTGVIAWSGVDQLAGDYPVSIYVDDGKGAYTTQDFTLTVVPNRAPAIVSSPQIWAESNQAYVYTVVATDADEDILSYFLAQGPAGMTISSTGDINWLPNDGDIGNHTVTIDVSDGKLTTSQTYNLAVSPENLPPEVSIHNLTEGAIASEPVDIVASIIDEDIVSWRLSYESNTTTHSQPVEIASGVTSVNNTVIANFDTSVLMNGQYKLVLAATDSVGHETTTTLLTYVEGGLKVGNFSFTVEDVNIPVSGIPVRVTRTYDTRRRNESLDFGYGWSMGYQDVLIAESRPVGSFWALNEYRTTEPGSDFATIIHYCIEPQGGAPTVTITLPNGDTETFEAYADPTCELYVPTVDVFVRYRSLDGESSLSMVDPALVRFNGDRLTWIGEQDTYDPNAYFLTTREGYVYHLEQGIGIVSVTDPNGNYIVYTDNGIIHSSGRSVHFLRDAQGRITSIVDPMGNIIDYAYDALGNLVSATDAAINTTTYQYNQGEHYLTDILDPLGRTVVKNIYDASGRLIAQEDGEGNRTEFDHDIVGRHSTVTDRLGRITHYYYDARGNVTTQIDALNNSTTFTYDADDNQLSKTDALSQTSTATYNDSRDQLTQTDPLGNTVSFTYNSRGQELTISDARSNVFTNTYDAFGNLLTIEDPLTNLAGQNIDVDGNVSLRRDVLGNETTFTYDSDGNLLTETDPLLNTVTKTYDANGNVLTESWQRTTGVDAITESRAYTYDANNRLTSTTDALGQTTYIQYDELGNETARVDALGQRTEMLYDAYRRLLRTTYPDGTSETNTYDAEGNLLTSTDRLNRITSYSYDALNRQTSVTYPDGSTMQTEYDALGQVVAEIDANGNRTDYGYDTAGRRTTVTDALGKVTTFNYDADGNIVQQTDANLHVTEYEYDALDRRTLTIFDDLTTITEGYDALGRLTSKTDQAGTTTNYEYDALGRLTAVVQTLDGVDLRTEYTYDEVGNRLTQKDANGRITSWTYDALGRVLSRSLPEGQVESFTYDANGNQVSHADFNGETFTFEYDSDNRLTRKVYPDTSEETYSYDAVGNRLAATDGNGTTSYEYDARDRLTKETKPDGNILEYGYDGAGNRTSVTTTVGTSIETTTYTYDALNRLETVTDNSLNVTTYTYDAVGNRASVSYPNGNVTSYTYDSLNRLTYQETQDATNSVIASYDYTLLDTGHRQQVTDHTGATTTYSYDDLYRLVGESINHPVLGTIVNDYTYDDVGNRTYSIEDDVHTAYTYDNNDRLLTAGGETHSYDANGNTVSVAIDTILTTYDYDYNNRLIEMIKTENAVEVDNVGYAYDVDGLRIAKNDDGLVTNYLVDKNRDYGQVLKELDDTNSTTVDYLYGDDLIKQSTASNDSYYLYDGLGSTRALSDDTGSVTDTYDYSAYGALIDQTGATQNSYLYTGEQFDNNLNNYYLRARYYDQSIGRFATQDTWMGNNQDPVTLHKYAYGNLDPVNHTDPTGNFSLGSLSAGMNINSILTTMTVVDVGSSLFNMSMEGEFTAKDVGLAVLIGMTNKIGGKGLLRLINKKLCPKGKCKVPPMIDEKHIYHGDISQRTRGTRATGYHSEADPMAKVQVISRTTPKINGVYEASIKIFNPNTGGYKKKSGRSTMFPRFWSKSMISASLYAAWNKGNGKSSGTYRVGNMKITYYVYQGVWLRGHPAR